MAEITAKQVVELRKRTGLGMMACKKALQESDGNIETAIEELRKKGMAKAAKRAERAASEGLIKILKTDDRHGAMIILNCETDFVARTDDFKALADEFAQFFTTTDVDSKHLGKVADIENIQKYILVAPYKDSTVGEVITDAIAKIGEKIELGMVVVERSDDAVDYLERYLHGNRVGVLVCLTTGKPETHGDERFKELAHDLAMQVAAAMPRVAEAIGRDDLDQAVVEKEKQILQDQAVAEGKPAEIAEKMVMGRINKFFGEVCLLEQPYIKDDKQVVKNIIKAAEKEIGDTIRVERFHRFQLGE